MRKSKRMVASLVEDQNTIGKIANDWPISTFLIMVGNALAEQDYDDAAEIVFNIADDYKDE